MQVSSPRKLDYSFPNQLPTENSIVTYSIVSSICSTETLYVSSKYVAICLI